MSSLLTGVCACRCSRTHLRNWLAFTPAFNARPDNDAPGCWQASTSSRLPTGSKLRLPPTPMRVTRKGKNERSSWVINCVRKLGLRTQSWILLDSKARWGKLRAYD